MPGLKDLMSMYAEATRHHTGLHYVPSFNDLNSNSADDLEEDVLRATADQAGARGQVATMKANHNKEDVAMPGMDPLVVDVHKVGRLEPGQGRRSQTYETVRPGSPSVWQYIVDAQQLQAATFSKLDVNKDGVLSAQELQQGVGVDSPTAKAMVREATKGRKQDSAMQDGVTQDEYREIIDRYLSS